MAVINEQTKVTIGLLLGVLAFVVAPVGWVVTKFNAQSERFEKGMSEIREMHIKSQSDICLTLKDHTSAITGGENRMLTLIKDQRSDIILLLNQQELKLSQQISEIRVANERKFEELQRDISGVKSDFAAFDRKLSDRWTTMEQERFVWMLRDRNPTVKVPDIKEVRAQ